MGTLSTTMKGYLEAYVGAGDAADAAEIDFVLEMKPVLLSTSSVVTVYSSAKGYDKVTGHAASLPRLEMPVLKLSILSDSFGRLRSDGRVDFEKFRTGSLEEGGFALLNTDGELDSWDSDYSWGDAECKLWCGRKSDAFGSWEEFFPFRIKGDPRWDFDRLRFEVRAALANLNQLAQTTAFAGTGTWEGSTDQKGKTKPLTLGRVVHAPATLVDYANLRYTFSTGEHGLEDIEEGYEAGFPIGATLSKSLANGGFSLGNAPTGEIGGDVKGEKFGALTTYEEEQGAVFVELLDREGYASVVNAADAATFTDSVGIHLYYDSPGLLRDALEFCLKPLGVYFPDQDGSEYRLFKLVDPTVQSASETYDQSEGHIHSIEQVGIDPPAWEVSVVYQRLWKVPGEVRDSGSATLFEKLSNEFRFATASDASIQTDYPNALRVVIDSPLYDATQAGTAATAALALFGTKRQTLRVTLARKILHSWVGDYVEIISPRYGLSGGKVMLVTGCEVDLVNERFVLEVWG